MAIEMERPVGGDGGQGDVAEGDVRTLIAFYHHLRLVRVQAQEVETLIREGAVVEYLNRISAQFRIAHSDHQPIARVAERFHATLLAQDSIEDFKGAGRFHEASNGKRPGIGGDDAHLRTIARQHGGKARGTAFLRAVGKG